jgi:preprotein translocase subunit SecA
MRQKILILQFLILNNKLSNDLSNSEKEEIFKQIESLENDLIEKKSEVLDRLLPEAFAVVKETAKRFFENEEIKVTASDFDKEIASKKSYTKIDSDKAIWKNNWDAGWKKCCLGYDSL